MEFSSEHTDQFVRNSGERAAFIEAHKESVDYQKIWQPHTPVLFLFDGHTVASSKDEIIANMSTFKQLGATHLAMEMLRDDQQDIIDRFLAGKVLAQTKLYEIFKEWSVTSDIPIKWLRMLEAARGLGMKIVGIDKNMGEKDYDTAEAIGERNIHWKEIIKGIIETTPNARIVVHGGADHGGYGILPTSVNELLQAEGVSSTVIDYIGGETMHQSFGIFDTFDTDQNFELATQKTGLGKRKFALNITSLGQQRSADYFIHLPQNEQPYVVKIVLGY